MSNAFREILPLKYVCKYWCGVMEVRTSSLNSSGRLPTIPSLLIAAATTARPEGLGYATDYIVIRRLPPVTLFS
jgi:hypothetical protein